MPYTYLIGWSTHNTYYYGCRYAAGCTPSDLWITYFTSSKRVRGVREQLGEPDVVQVRTLFEDPHSCIRHEARVLRRLVGRPNFLNKNVAGAIVGGNTSPRTEKQRASARQLMSNLSKGLWYTDGVGMKRIVAGADIPQGWYRGYPDSYKQKLSDILSGRPGQFKNMEWYNNGVARARFHVNAVPEGWIKGWKIIEAK